MKPIRGLTKIISEEIKIIDQKFRDHIISYAKTISRKDNYYDQIEFINAIRKKIDNFSFVRTIIEPFYELRTFPYNKNDLGPLPIILNYTRIIAFDLARLSILSYPLHNIINHFSK